MTDYYTIGEVSELLRVNKRTVNTYIKNGTIPAVRLTKKTIRIPKKEFAESMIKASVAKNRI